MTQFIESLKKTNFFVKGGGGGRVDLWSHGPVGVLVRHMLHVSQIRAAAAAAAAAARF